jgi:hypothetical protein
MDLTDEEIAHALKVTIPIKRKWQDIFRSKLRHQNFTEIEAMRLLDQFENELTYELATKCNMLAHVDAEPVFLGEPPIIEFTGKIGSSTTPEEFDHEKKEWEVKKSKELGEDFLGAGHLE